MKNTKILIAPILIWPDELFFLFQTWLIRVKFMIKSNIQFLITIHDKYNFYMEKRFLHFFNCLMFFMYLVVFLNNNNIWSIVDFKKI